MSTTLSAYQLVADHLSTWQQITASSPKCCSAMYDLNNTGSTAATIRSSLAGANAILAGAAKPVRISSDLLLSLQNLKLGGKYEQYIFEVPGQVRPVA
jgi:hypothetical protein